MHSLCPGLTVSQTSRVHHCPDARRSFKSQQLREPPPNLPFTPDRRRHIYYEEMTYSLRRSAGLPHTESQEPRPVSLEQVRPAHVPLQGLHPSMARGLHHGERVGSWTASA